MGFPPYECFDTGKGDKRFSEETENRNSIVLKTPVKRELNLCCFRGVVEEGGCSSLDLMRTFIDHC